MLVSGAIIDESFGESGFYAGFGYGRAGGEAHGEFEEIERRSCIPFREGGEVTEKLGVDQGRRFVVRAFDIESALEDCAYIFVCELLQGECATSGEKGVLDLERRIFGRGAYQYNLTAFDWPCCL